jgi:endonuclease IV
MIGPVLDDTINNKKNTIKTKLVEIRKLYEVYGAIGIHAPETRNKVNILQNREYDLNDRILELFPSWNIRRAQIQQFKNWADDLNTSGISPHGTYLINLASDSLTVRENSVSLLVKQILMCRTLNLNNLVFHPGSNPCTRSGTLFVMESIRRLSERLPEGCVVCMENLCGKNSLFKTRQQILQIYDLVCSFTRSNIYFCFDTAHYIIAENELKGMVDLMRVIKPRLKVIHLNTPLKNYKPHVDRHGLTFSGHLNPIILADVALEFSNIPCILQTPHSVEKDRADECVEFIKFEKSRAAECNTSLAG